MTSICEKKFLAEVRLINVEQMPLYNFIAFRKGDRHKTEDWTTEARHFKLMGIYEFF